MRVDGHEARPGNLRWHKPADVLLRQDDGTRHQLTRLRRAKRTIWWIDQGSFAIPDVLVSVAWGRQKFPQDIYALTMIPSQSKNRPALSKLS